MVVKLTPLVSGKLILDHSTFDAQEIQLHNAEIFIMTSLTVSNIVENWLSITYSICL